MPNSEDAGRDTAGAGDGPDVRRGGGATPGANEPLRLLLVEDNPGDARLLQEYLADSGLAIGGVERAEDLGSALEMLASAVAPPDAVLLDLDLPDAEGLETVERVTETAPALPVIVLTGLDDRSTAVAAVREGAQDYLVKGELEPELLARSVRYALERKRAERGSRANGESSGCSTSTWRRSSTCGTSPQTPSGWPTAARLTSGSGGVRWRRSSGSR